MQHAPSVGQTLCVHAAPDVNTASAAVHTLANHTTHEPIEVRQHAPDTGHETAAHVCPGVNTTVFEKNPFEQSVLEVTKHTVGFPGRQQAPAQKPAVQVVPFPWNDPLTDVQPKLVLLKEHPLPVQHAPAHENVAHVTPGLNVPEHEDDELTVLQPPSNKQHAPLCPIAVAGAITTITSAITHARTHPIPTTPRPPTNKFANAITTPPAQKFQGSSTPRATLPSPGHARRHIS